MVSISPSNVRETGMRFVGSLWASGEYDASHSISTFLELSTIIELCLPRFDSERTQVALSKRQLVHGRPLCTTSQRTFRLRQTTQALGARRFTGADISDAFRFEDSTRPKLLVSSGEGIFGKSVCTCCNV